MTEDTLPKLYEFPEEFVNRVRALERLVPTSQSFQSAQEIHKEAEREVIRLVQFKWALTTPAFMKTLGSYFDIKAKEGYDVPPSQDALMAWGEEAESLLSNMNDTIDQAKDAMFSAVKEALHKLGMELGNKHREQSTGPFISYWNAMSEASTIRKGQLDGLAVCYDDGLNKEPPFMSGFAKGYFDKETCTAKMIQDIRKAFSVGSRQALQCSTEIMNLKGDRSRSMRRIVEHAGKIKERPEQFQKPVIEALKAIAIEFEPFEKAELKIRPGSFAPGGF